MRRIAVLGVSVLVPSLLGGCATVLSGRDQKIPVTTDPMGASVQVDAGATFIAPADLNLARKDDHTLLISKDGYHTAKVNISKNLNPAFLGNIIIGGVVGGVIDYFSGAAAQLYPEKVHVVLEPCRVGELAQVREWNPKAAKPAPELASAKGEAPAPSSPGNDETYSPSKAKRN
jgi:hypothetical protein